MSIATLLLTVLTVLIFFGVLERVLDRMYLTDRAAFLIVLMMLVGTLLPNLTIGNLSVNLGGGLIPLGVCIWLMVKADTGRERLHAVAGAVMTAALVLLCAYLLPDEPERLPVEPMLLYGVSGGLVAFVLGRSRRNAFICGVGGVMLADTVTAIINWQQGINQPLILGGAGLADAVVISGVLAVGLTELLGELLERIVRRRHQKGGATKS